jgi:hypothetical protein
MPFHFRQPFRFRLLPIFSFHLFSHFFADAFFHYFHTPLIDIIYFAFDTLSIDADAADYLIIFAISIDDAISFSHFFISPYAAALRERAHFVFFFSLFAFSPPPLVCRFSSLIIASSFSPIIFVD